MDVAPLPLQLLAPEAVVARNCRTDAGWKRCKAQATMVAGGNNVSMI